MDKWYKSAGLVAASAVALAAIGWWFGPPKQNSNETLNDEDPCSKKHDEILYAQMQELNHLMSEGRDSLKAAEVKANQILKYIESVWGPRHLNYGLVLGVPLANIYEASSNMKKWEEALQTAMTVLMEKGEEYVVDTGIVDKLINCMSIKGNYSKAADYARLLAKVKREMKNKNPGDNEILMKYGGSLTKVGMILSNAGQFKQAESIFKEVIDIFSTSDPTSTAIYNCIEFYTNALHQQGKTTDAITVIEEYKQKIASLPHSAQIIRMLLNRASTLCFAVDLFQKSLEFHLEVIKFSEENSLPLNCQIYAELATLYWELGKEDEAISAQSKIKNFKLSSRQSQPLIRSKYLTTISCQIKEEGKYYLEMRVNRELPQRREGEPLEEVESIKRKLDQCFLEVTFDNTQKNQAPVTINVDVTSPHQFVVESQPLGGAEPEWYEVVIVVYEDPRKHKRLGTHHQPIYFSPPSMTFRSPLLT